MFSRLSLLQITFSGDASTVGLRNKSEATPVWVSPDSAMLWMHSGGGQWGRIETEQAAFCVLVTGFSPFLCLSCLMVMSAFVYWVSDLTQPGPEC